MECRVMIVNDEEQALRQINSLQQEGYPINHMYILGSDEQLVDELVEISGTQHATIAAEGMTSALKRLVRTQGQRLLAEMEALGLCEEEVAEYELALAFGGYLIVAKPRPESQAYISAEIMAPDYREPLGYGW